MDVDVAAAAVAALKKKANARREMQNNRDAAMGLVVMQPDAGLLLHIVRITAMEIRVGFPMRYLTTAATIFDVPTVLKGAFKPPMSENETNQLKWHDETDTRYLVNHNQSREIITNALASIFACRMSSNVVEALTNTNMVLELHVCDMGHTKRTRYS